MRLLPRFSLRTALIALTVFLIAFGVGVNYYQRNQAHEQLGFEFQRMNCNIEEEPITLFGYVIGKRLTGIEITPRFGDAGSVDFEQVKDLSLLERIPRPHEVRRFGIKARGIQQKDLTRIFTALLRFPELEEVYLSGLLANEAQTNLIARLPKLRVLCLNDCMLPKGVLRQWDQLPNLEKLKFERTDFELAELMQLRLPRLRVFEMKYGQLLELHLTKQGWGRFPSLETLILGEDMQVQRIVTEPGGMPQLKQLALYGELYNEQSPVTPSCNWPSWPAALPQLQVLGLRSSWLDDEFPAAAAKFPQLTRLYLETSLPRNGSAKIAPLTGLSPEQLAAGIYFDARDAAKQLLAQRPEILYDADYEDVSWLLNPLGLGPQSNEDHWDSPHWRVSPKQMGGIF